MKFNVTKIEFDLAKTGDVVLELFDVRGKKVKNLINENLIDKNLLVKNESFETYVSGDVLIR